MASTATVGIPGRPTSSTHAPLSASPDFSPTRAKNEVPRAPTTPPTQTDLLRPTGEESQSEFSELRIRLRGILARQNVSVDPHLAKIMRDWARFARTRGPTKEARATAEEARATAKQRQLRQQAQLDTGPQNSIGQNSIGQNSIGQNSIGQNSIGQNSIGQNSIDQDANPQDANSQDTNSQDANPQDANPQDANPQDANPQDCRKPNAPPSTPEVEIPIQGLLNHPLIASLGVDAESVVRAAEELGPKVVQINRHSGCLCPIMRGERSTLFLRDLPVNEVTAETLTQLILEAPMVPDASVITSIRHEPVGNLWFVTLSSSSLATETALWLRQQNFQNREIVVGVKSEAEYVSLVAKPPANFNVEGMFVPGKAFRIGGRVHHRVPPRACDGQVSRPGYYSSPRWRGWIHTGPPGTFPANAALNGLMRYEYAQDPGARSPMNNNPRGGGQFPRGASAFHQRGRGAGSRRGGSNFNYNTRDGMMVLPHRIQSLKTIQQHTTSRRKNSPRKGDCAIACDRNHACLPFAPDEIDDVNDFPPITLAAKMSSESLRVEQIPPSL